MNLTQTKRSLLTNTSVQFLARLFSSTLSFLLSLILIRHFGVAFYGDFVKVTALLFFNNTFVDLGINAFIVRRLANLEPTSQKKLLHHLIHLRFVLAFVGIGLTLTWLFLFNPPNYPPNLKYAYLIGSLSVLSFALHLSAVAWFQFKLTYFKSALASSLGSFGFFLNTLLLLFFPPNLQLLLLAFSLGYLLTTLLSLWFTRSIFINLNFHLLQAKNSLYLLKASFWLSLAFIFSSLANRADILIASIYRPAVEIGQYGFAYKIFDFIIAVPSLLMNAVYPLLLKKPSFKQSLTLKVIWRLLGLSIVFMLLLFVLAPLILYLRPNLNLAVGVLRLLALSLPLFYLTPPLMWLLISLHQEKQLTFVYILATLTNISLNFTFIPHYGVLASALITLITEFVIFLSLLILIKINARMKFKHYD